jgi:hypothetical protein
MSLRTPDTRPPGNSSSGRFRRSKAVAGVLLAGSALTACFPAATPQEFPKQGIVTDKHTDTIRKCFDAGSLDDDSCSVAGESTRYEYHLTLAACSLRDTVKLLADPEYLQHAVKDPSDYPVTSEGNADKTPGMDPARDYPCEGDIIVSSHDRFDQIATGTLWLPNTPTQ